MIKREFKIKEVLGAIKLSHAIVSNVANKLKCDWHTAKRAIDKWDETKQAFEDEDENTGDFIESKALEKVNEGSEQMIRFYLATKYKKRGFTERHEVTGEDGAPVEIMQIIIDKDNKNE